MENLKKEIKTEIKKEKVKKDTIPQVEHVLDLYFKTDDPKRKQPPKVGFRKGCL